MQMFLQHGSYKYYNTDVLTISDAEDDTLLSVESMVNEEVRKRFASRGGGIDGCGALAMDLTGAFLGAPLNSTKLIYVLVALHGYRGLRGSSHGKGARWGLPSNPGRVL